MERASAQVVTVNTRVVTHMTFKVQRTSLRPRSVQSGVASWARLWTALWTVSKGLLWHG